MLTRFREEYRKGLLASDMKYHRKHCRKALRKSHGPAPLVYTRVTSANRDRLLRCGWSIADSSHTRAGGTGSSWTDTYVLSLPRAEALKSLDLPPES